MADQVTPDEGPPVPDLDRSRRIHLVGVGGAGMSAIAEVLVAQGHRVSGSDQVRSPVVERLGALGVDVTIGHDAAAVDGAEIVSPSTAIPADNPELVAARARGLPVLRRGQVLAAIAARRRTIAIAGTHGKTTTTAMLATTLAGCGVRPSYIVGGLIGGLATGARWDTGAWLVVEADESDGSFLDLPVEVAVVTSVAPDHLDHWGDLESLEDAFERFLAGARRPLVCADDEPAARIGRRVGAATYGTAADADYRIVDLVLEPAASRFGLEHTGLPLARVRVPAPGSHNALNAAAALAAAAEGGAVAGGSGPPLAAAVAAMGAYPGVDRRFQVRGQVAGVTVVDDYAHLPAKVAAAVASARGGGWRRVVCVFQPHRYSRTAALWREFGAVFDGVDLLVVTDVYGAGEAPRPGITGKLIVDAVCETRPTQAVVWLPSRAEVVAYLRSHLRPGDVCLTVGAGDVTTLAGDLLAGDVATTGPAGTAR
ncbi:MAG TPA: UDP-N-acetylmuramate--L-alanine ligase [Acidimicrobiales bacterium]|nr:UDP-N-acetylmuramate--L-alanine ligase [Acidimicrobiales bacterium]